MFVSGYGELSAHIRTLGNLWSVCNTSPHKRQQIYPSNITDVTAAAQTVWQLIKGQWFLKKKKKNALLSFIKATVCEQYSKCMITTCKNWSLRVCRVWHKCRVSCLKLSASRQSVQWDPGRVSVPIPPSLFMSGSQISPPPPPPPPPPPLPC